MLSELLITGFLNLSMASVLTGIPAFDASAKECAAFIGNNFSSFREEMRAARKDFSLFSASSIEDSYPVFVCEDGRDAYFLDFDDDNGYALVGQGRELLDFSPSGSLKKPSGSYPIYSRYEGFLNKNQVNALETNRNNSEKNDNGKNDLCGVSTTLQISDIDSYVLSHYGTGYSLEEIVNKYTLFG